MIKEQCDYSVPSDDLNKNIADAKLLFCLHSHACNDNSKFRFHWPSFAAGSHQSVCYGYAAFILSICLGLLSFIVSIIV